MRKHLAGDARPRANPVESSSEEVALEPQLVLCDSHHHLWTRHSTSKHFQAEYLVEDLRRDLDRGHRVAHTVYVECRSEYRPEGPDHLRPVGETQWVVGLDTGPGIVDAIVGYADLHLGEAAEEVLLAHLEAGDGRFRGVRPLAAWHEDPEIRSISTSPPPPGVLAEREFRHGVGVLARLGLTLDAWVYFTQLGEVAALARAVPELTIVVNHLGGPVAIGRYAGHRDEMMAEWRAAVRSLVPCENVVMKLGGVGMPFYGSGWHQQGRTATSDEIIATWGADIRWCIEQLGPNRCMFESNFAVDAVSCGYTELWNAFKKMTRDLSEHDRAAVLHDTAVRVYRIERGVSRNVSAG